MITKFIGQSIGKNYYRWQHTVSMPKSPNEWQGLVLKTWNKVQYPDKPVSTGFIPFPAQSSTFYIFTLQAERVCVCIPDGVVELQQVTVDHTKLNKGHPGLCIKQPKAPRPTELMSHVCTPLT
jgi:hypothetical protein